MAIITISRGSLSGGRALAECLAKRLGYPMVGREVLQEAAEGLGIPVEVIRGKLETPPGLWARLRGEQEKYVLAVQTALAEWCTRGNLVYHGLAGQFLLRDLPGVLRVRIIAPLDMRVRAFLDSNPEMTRAQAETFIRDVDEGRARWVKTIYGEEIMDPYLYDLIVNLRTLTLESACEVLAEAIQQPRFQITAEVEAELFSFAAQCRTRLARAMEG